MEELQRNSSINHGLVTEQDVEQKSKELRMLGETLTELKSKSCWNECGMIWFECEIFIQELQEMECCYTLLCSYIFSPERA